MKSTKPKWFDIVTVNYLKFSTVTVYPIRFESLWQQVHMYYQSFWKTKSSAQSNHWPSGLTVVVSLLSKSRLGLPSLTQLYAKSKKYILTLLEDWRGLAKYCWRRIILEPPGIWKIIKFICLYPQEQHAFNTHDYGRYRNLPDSKVHGANMGPIWGRHDPGGPHVGPMLAPCTLLSGLNQECVISLTQIIPYAHVYRYLWINCN